MRTSPRTPGIVLTNVEGRALGANQSFLDAARLRPVDLLGADMDELFEVTRGGLDTEHFTARIRSTGEVVEVTMTPLALVSWRVLIVSVRSP